MKKFKVQVGFAKNANRVLINSNKLKNVFYNTSNNFIVNEEDYGTAVEILERNMIKVIS